MLDAKLLKPDLKCKRGQLTEPVNNRDFGETGPRGPFLKSPGNVSGPKSNIQIYI